MAEVSRLHIPISEAKKPDALRDPLDLSITPEQFLLRLKSRPNLSILSGAEVFCILLEEAGKIPSQSMIDYESSRAEQFVKLHDMAQDDPAFTTRALYKRELQRFNVVGDQITTDMVKNVKGLLAQYKDNRTSTVERLNAQWVAFNLSFAKTGTDRLDFDEIEDLFKQTDAYVQDDELLMFAQALRNLTSGGEQGEQVRQPVLNFERLARYMFRDFYHKPPDEAA